MRRLMTARVVWRGKTSETANFIAFYFRPVHPGTCQGIFIIHLDLIGPLPVTADGSTYLLTIFDRTTRWLEVVPLPSMEATMCAEALISMWISRYGMPSNITTDRGRQFTSARGWG